MPTTPEQRLGRLLRHALAGWQRAGEDSGTRLRAVQCLETHPSALPAIDQLWIDCLHDRGPLHTWLRDGARPEAWSHDIALHSALAGHPFPDLPQWTESPT